jgi:energy-coupling factor transporter ATP-binding protein EcfA2
MSGETFYGLREMILPGPSQTTGYRTILVIGTTGAGKSTLIRQLMGTDASDGFPATSASKTTVAETELLLAPGDYYAVATFMPLVEVRAYVEENVVAAALAIFDDRPATEVRSRLLDHVDQRFRLRYLMGDGLRAVDSRMGATGTGPGGGPDGGDPASPEDGPGSGDADTTGEGDAGAEGGQGDTGAIISEIHRLLDEAINAEVETMIAAGVATADTPEEELHVLLKDRLSVNSTVVEIVEFLISEIRARIDVLAQGDVVTSRDNWPLYWRCSEHDRATFLQRLRTFAGNDAADFGRLLTPVINGVRVRGPFHPTWAREIPYVMLIDREGLGHTPDSVSSLPSSTTRTFDEVDSIIIVDNAQQPMQAAPVAAMRQIAAAGHGDKLIVCFSHFELVEGPNLPNLDARRYHVIASVDQVLSAIGNELGYPTERLLRQRLDRNLYLLSRLHQRVDEDTDPDTYAELRWLLGQLRVEAEPLDLGGSLPRYSEHKLHLSVDDAIAAYLRYWELRLGVATDPAIRPAHWSKVKALCVRYARRASDEYESMRPAGDLIAALTDSLRRFAAEPEGWSGDVPEEDTEQHIYDSVTRRANGQLRMLVNDRLFLDAAELWSEARDVSGPGAAQRRAELVYAKILQPLVGSGGGTPMGEHPDFISAVVHAIRTEAEELGVTFD